MIWYLKVALLQNLKSKVTTFDKKIITFDLFFQIIAILELKIIKVAFIDFLLQ